MESFSWSCKSLKERVCDANIALYKSGLIISTFGNVSEKIIIDGKVLIGIKPSGVDYSKLKPENIVLLSDDGIVVDGFLRPSTDTPTHLILYKFLPNIFGVSHTHSPFASAWAQAELDIPPLGTTHADYVKFAVPCTDGLSSEQIAKDYETNTGLAIIERLKAMEDEDATMVLVRNHGPFAMGKTAIEAVENAILLEEIAKIAYLTTSLNPSIKPIGRHLHNKHYDRKHGSKKYYGQN